MAQRIHYIHQVPVNQLFTQERNALYELPAKPFIARRLLKQKTNGYGEVVLDKKHRYALDSSYRNSTVLVETYPWDVKVYDIDGSFLEQFPRVYGEEVSASVNIKTCIENVLKKPNSWHNSLLREYLPTENVLKTYLDALQEPVDIKRTLYRFNDAMETFG
jgi:hypothetical protein